MSELHDAWDAVHRELPAGWVVNEPSWHEEDSRWHVVAADRRPGRKRPESIESFGHTPAEALRGLAQLLVAWEEQALDDADVEAQYHERAG